MTLSTRVARVLFVSFLAGSAPSAFADPIAYSVTTLSAGGATLSGTFTTDGTLGRLSARNVTSSSLVITYGGTVYPLGLPTDGPLGRFEGVFATETSVTIEIALDWCSNQITCRPGAIRIDEAKDIYFYGEGPAAIAIGSGIAGGPFATAMRSVATVGIDIKPGSFPNSINLSSSGATPVAILGSATLNVFDIDVSTLMLGTAGIKTVGKADRFLCSYADVSGNFSGGPEGAADGLVDLVCHFNTQSIVPEEGGTTAKVTGDLLSGGAFEGTDAVNIVP
jgi:hypothetical protein